MAVDRVELGGRVIVLFYIFLFVLFKDYLDFSSISFISFIHQACLTLWTIKQTQGNFLGNDLYS